jgi:hypothetical protein
VALLFRGGETVLSSLFGSRTEVDRGEFSLLLGLEFGPFEQRAFDLDVEIVSPAIAEE